jgi:AraC-like DNA-binding protein
LLDTAAIESGTGLSARYINELFEHEDTSLMRYVWNSRLTHCHKELSSPDCFPNRISEVALQWGFNDFSHFSRAFKKKYGVSPRDVRNH